MASRTFDDKFLLFFDKLDIIFFIVINYGRKVSWRNFLIHRIIQLYLYIH